jgi:ATP-binding cassette, subfamily G (WHITE), member 2, SNQ2
LGPNQVCTLFGARPGSNTTSGRSYLEAAYGMDEHVMWRRNFVVLLGWILFYQITQILILDLFPVSIVQSVSLRVSAQITKRHSGGPVFYLFAKETPETRKLNARLGERKIRQLRAKTTERDGSENNPESCVT